MEKPLGIYIHIPFCAGKCLYCDFYSLAGHDSLMPKYQSALISHIRESELQMAPYLIDSVYVGGGTPSYFGARRICEVLNALKRSAQVLKTAEMTVEINPDSATLRDLKLLRSEGVNRLSIGVQSANDDILKLIGRRHTFKQAVTAVERARKAGFRNISIDLIYGLPSQSKSDWADTLTKAIALRPDHISCYGLKLEEGTPMYEYAGSPFVPTDDEQADMYLYAVETLESHDYNQYEISNFAKDGFESLHNLKYWNRQDYMSFGCGAHSCVDNLRYSFISDIETYISGVNGETNIIEEYEEINRLDRAAEYIMLGMRCVAGVSKEEYTSIYQSDFDNIEALLEEYHRKGWAVKKDESWHFTPSGFLLSNLLIGALLEAQAEQKIDVNPWSRDAYDNTIEKTELPVGDEIYLRNSRG